MSRGFGVTTKRALAACLIVGAALLVAVSPAMGKTFKPTRFNDPAPDTCQRFDCSLREAVIAANNHPGADKIVLRAGKRYKLTIAGSEDDALQGDLDVKGTLAVRSSGLARSTITAAGLDGTLDAATTPSKLSLTRLQFVNGAAQVVGGKRLSISACGFRGGSTSSGVVGLKGTSVRNSSFGPTASGGVGVVGLERLSVSGSHFTKVGAIAVDGVGTGPVKVSRTTIRKSVFGVFAAVSGSLTVDRTRIRGGGATSTYGVFAASVARGSVSRSSVQGFLAGNILLAVAHSAKISNSRASGSSSGFGAVVSGAGPNTTASVKRSSFVGNKGGGGLLVAASIKSAKLTDLTLANNVGTSAGGLLVAITGRVSVSDSTISGNRATAPGGGAYILGSRVAITNTTVASNRSSDFGGGLILTAGGTSATARSLTIINNRADTDNSGGESGGGLIASAGSTLKIFNSVIAQNRVGTGSTDPDCVGGFTVAHNNARGRASPGCAGFHGHGNFVSRHMRIGRLRDNGGPTKTACPVHGSPLLEKAKGPPKLDQRGRKRKGKRDIGACELTV